MQHLPHRAPMLFVDRVIELGDDSIVIESDISAEADFFKGHFPNMPIMPGVVIVETVAQAGALLVSLTRGLDDEKFIAFSGVEAAKFKRPVYPNETLRVEVSIEKVRGPFYKFAGKALVEDKVAATLTFTAAQMDFDADKSKG
jgi:3-hydroxyacyl-[acyl-carrier-protein] dehydratase